MSGERESKRLSDTVSIPLTSVMRVVKNGLPDGMGMMQDTRLQFHKATSLFLFHLTAVAAGHCKKAKRTTLNADDVMMALEDLEFEDLLEPVNTYLKAFRSERSSKKELKNEENAAAAASSGSTSSGSSSGSMSAAAKAKMLAGRKRAKEAEEAQALAAKLEQDRRVEETAKRRRLDPRERAARASTAGNKDDDDDDGDGGGDGDGDGEEGENDGNDDEESSSSSSSSSVGGGEGEGEGETGEQDVEAS